MNEDVIGLETSYAVFLLLSCTSFSDIWDSCPY